MSEGVRGQEGLMVGRGAQRVERMKSLTFLLSFSQKYLYESKLSNPTIFLGQCCNDIFSFVVN